MKGGKLIGTGSMSCFFDKEFLCSDETKSIRVINSSNVGTKIVFSKNAKEKTIGEEKMNTMIKKIKGYDSWAIVFDTFCEPPSFKELQRVENRNDLLKCIQLLMKEKKMNDMDLAISLFDENSYMMKGKLGGVTFNVIFGAFVYSLGDIPRGIQKTPEDIETLMNEYKIFQIIKGRNPLSIFTHNFIELMKMMKPLFEGILALNKNKICHNDIKYENIVYDVNDKCFKFIDFGLSCEFTETDKFIERSKKEFRTGRIYTPYPLDYLYLSKMEKISALETRRNYELFDKIQFDNQSKGNLSLFQRKDCNIESVHTNILKNRKNYVEEVYVEEVIEKIDVYSLGILIPELFLEYFKDTEDIILLLRKNPIVESFILLFGDMCHPHLKERITIQEANKRFTSLVKQHS